MKEDKTHREVLVDQMNTMKNEMKERIWNGIKWAFFYGISFFIIWVVGTKVGVSSFPPVIKISNLWIGYLSASMPLIFVIAFVFAPVKNYHFNHHR